MFYKLAHIFQNKFPFIWVMIEWVNSYLFLLRYGRKLKSIEECVLFQYAQKLGVKIVRISDVPVVQLEKFFTEQPEDAFTFFKPHGFDRKNLKKLQSNRSFLAYVLIDNNRIAAYCFLRSFFIGKGFRGRMVGINFRGRGHGTMMNKMMNDVGFGIGLRIFETVSKENVASYRSALSASRVKVVEDLKHNELYLEILKEQ